MVTLAAATQGNPIVGGCTLLTIVGLLVGVSLVYAHFYPRRACRKCGVTGKVHQPRSKERFWGECSRCNGTGWEYRLGYRFMQWWQGRSTR